jgi:hypothetical protein
MLWIIWCLFPATVKAVLDLRLSRLSDLLRVAGMCSLTGMRANVFHEEYQSFAIGGRVLVAGCV